MIEQKRVRVGWIGGDHLLGKLQEYEQVRSGKFILAINSNLQKIPKRYHRHVCGVVLHEVKHLEQLLSLLVTQTLNLNNHLSDEHIAQLEDEAYQIEDRYLRFYNLRRDQLQLPRSQMTGFITSSQAHGVLQPEWFKMILTEMIQQVPKGDIERLRLQRLQLALHDRRQLQIASTNETLSDGFNFEYDDSEKSEEAPLVLLLNLKSLSSLPPPQLKSRIEEIANEWYEVAPQ
jgi:hypothetical protein